MTASTCNCGKNKVEILVSKLVSWVAHGRGLVNPGPWSLCCFLGQDNLMRCLGQTCDSLAWLAAYNYNKNAHPAGVKSPCTDSAAMEPTLAQHHTSYHVFLNSYYNEN